MAKTKQTARKVDQSGRQAGMVNRQSCNHNMEEVPEEEEVAQGEAIGGSPRGSPGGNRGGRGSTP